MIFLDDRIGSRHYAAMIPGSQITRLEAGDAAWDTADGRLVGVEIKKVLDAVACMYSSRLADRQIPVMRQIYDINYLIVEGLWQAEPSTGILQYYKGELGRWGKWIDVTSGRKRLMYSAFEQWLTTMSLAGGLLLRSTPHAESTATLLRSLYAWHQRMDHKSFHVLDENFGDGAELTRPGMLRRMIALLPRVGWHRSGILVRRFKSVQDMAQSKPEQWLIEREIGPETAVKIIEALNGEGH